MALRIDPAGMPEEPTLVLGTSQGTKIGTLIGVENWEFKRSLSSTDEMSFTVYKYVDGIHNYLWDKINNFRLVWYREMDEWFSISVELDEGDTTTKHISAIGICEAELSQTNIHDIEINTESDILRDDYVITTFYNQDDPDGSLLNRLLYKNPAFSIGHIDSSLQDIQRQFSWSESSVYDALMDVGEEIGCVFLFGNGTDSNGNIQRTINAYDLQYYCRTCGKRFEGDGGVCPYCESTDIREPVGKDSGIVVSRDNLAPDIQLTTDTDSVKNCFKLEAGDDVMTDAVKLFTPDGSGYIWYIPDYMKEDMTDELRAKLDAYDEDYAYYSKDADFSMKGTSISKTLSSANLSSLQSDLIAGGYPLSTPVAISYTNALLKKRTVFTPLENLVITGTKIANDDTGDNKNAMIYVGYEAYNALVDKYASEKYSHILPGGTEDAEDGDIVLHGYANLMEAEFSALDLYYYVHDSMMPTYTKPNKKAVDQAGAAKTGLTSGVALMRVSTSTSKETATSAIRSMTRMYIDSARYDVEVHTASWNTSTYTWTGSITVTNRDDEEDTASTTTFDVAFTDNMQKYLKQLLDKKVYAASWDADDYDILDLFDKDLSDFTESLHNYAYSVLDEFHMCCETCLDVLIEQGCGNSTITASGYDGYNLLYVPWRAKYDAIAKEMDARAYEVEIVSQMQEFIEDKIEEVHEALDFENYIGTDLWKEFSTFRREDTYQNSNYISDGLTNAEIVENAEKFLDVANREIYKSAELQHSISCTLNDLLVIPEFAPLREDFDVGTWIRVIVDEVPYKLRLVEYTLSWNDLSQINVEFSDATKITNGISDVRSILSNAQRMATSYGAVIRKADQGNTAAKSMRQWIVDGLDATLMNIVNSAEKQQTIIDENGITQKQYDDILDEYSPIQTKMINGTIAFTEDDWQSVKTAVGRYYDADGNVYWGLIGDVLIGRILAGANLIIQDKDEDGTMLFNVDKEGVFIRDASLIMVNGDEDTKKLIKTKNNKHIVTIENSTATDKRLMPLQDGVGGIFMDPAYGFAAGSTNLYITDGTTATPIFMDDNGLILDADGMPVNANIYIDMDGNVYLRGRIVAVSGSIGGLNISNNAIYSGSKSSYGSNVTGLYIGNDGSFNLGNGAEYIKYDSQNGMKIHANKIQLTSGGFEEGYLDLESTLMSRLNTQTQYIQTDDPVNAPSENDEGWTSVYIPFDPSYYVWTRTAYTDITGNTTYSVPKCITGAYTHFAYALNPVLDPDMYSEWEAGETYVAGARISYNGTVYRVLQDHTAQAGSVPTNADTLYSAMTQQENDCIATRSGDRIITMGNNHLLTKQSEIGFSTTPFEGAVYLGVGLYSDEDPANINDYTKYEWNKVLGRGILATHHYFLLQADTAPDPAVPTTLIPGPEWTELEPVYQEGDTSILYETTCIEYDNGTFEYFPVTVSSTYAAARIAYERALQAEAEANAVRSEITQKVDSIKLSVSNGFTESSITLSMDGAQDQTAQIKMNGLVTFSDLDGTSGRTTTIDGGLIKTDTVVASKIYADQILGGRYDGLDRYISPSAINTTSISNAIGGNMKVFKAANSTTLGGYIGFGTGSTTSSDGDDLQTVGVHMCDKNASSEVIVTSAGARMSHGVNQLSINDSAVNIGTSSNRTLLYAAGNIQSYGNIQAGGNIKATRHIIGSYGYLYGTDTKRLELSPEVGTVFFQTN